MNEQEAQKFLAEQLKDTIFFVQPKQFHWHTDGAPLDKRWPKVKQTEWDSIARLVEGKLTEEQQVKYITALWKQHPHSSRDDLYSWSQSSLSQRIWWWLTHADYIQRATALKQTIGEE